MNYKTIGNSDLKSSVIGLGTWAIGDNFWGNYDENESIRAIQAGIDNGINLIDTAPAYGEGRSEELVGKAIKGYRDKVIVATKIGCLQVGEDYILSLKPESICKEIENTLSRLDIDCIDLYQIHWPDESTPLEDSLGMLKKLQEQGKFRYLGVSNFTKDLIEQASGIMDIVSLQPRYSLIEREIEQELLPYCVSKNISVLSYGSLGAGILSGKYHDNTKLSKGDRRKEFYPYFEGEMFERIQQLLVTLKEIAAKYEKPVAHIAINWVWAHEGVCALVGARNEKQAKQNADAGSWKLSQEDMNMIEAAYTRAFASYKPSADTLAPKSE